MSPAAAAAAEAEVNEAKAGIWLAQTGVQGS
jgi:hypothetical protein